MCGVVVGCLQWCVDIVREVKEFKEVREFKEGQCSTVGLLPKLPNKDKGFSDRGLLFAVGAAIVEQRVCCVGWWSVVCCGALILLGKLRNLENLRRGSAVQ